MCWKKLGGIVLVMLLNHPCWWSSLCTVSLTLHNVSVQVNSSTIGALPKSSTNRRLAVGAIGSWSGSPCLLGVGFWSKWEKASKMDVGRKKPDEKMTKIDKRLCLLPFWKEQTRCWESHTSRCFLSKWLQPRNCQYHVTTFETFVASIESLASSWPLGFYMVSPWSYHWASGTRKDTITRADVSSLFFFMFLCFPFTCISFDHILCIYNLL